MNEPKIEKLFESSCYLKQYICKLAVVSMMLKIESQVHVVPLEEKEYSFLSKLSLDYFNNVFAIGFSGFAYDIVLKVELLSKLIVLAKFLILIPLNKVSA